MTLSHIALKKPKHELNCRSNLRARVTERDAFRRPPPSQPPSHIARAYYLNELKHMVITENRRLAAQCRYEGLNCYGDARASRLSRQFGVSCAEVRAWVAMMGEGLGK